MRRVVLGRCCKRPEVEFGMLRRKRKRRRKNAEKKGRKEEIQEGKIGKIPE
jgi:hypothetical protein